MSKKTDLVTFTKWCANKADRTPVSVNPADVSDVEDYCGSINPGQLITLRNKKSYLVWGDHSAVVAKLAGGET